MGRRIILPALLLAALATGCLYFTDLTGLRDSAPPSPDGSTDGPAAADGNGDGPDS